MAMRPSALERSKPPWPQWPALDHRCPCRDAAVLLLPSAHLRRAAPSVVGACLRERKEAFFPPAHQNQERKKQSRSFHGVQALCSQSWLCAQAVCVSFWCLSGVLLGVNGCTQSLSVFWFHAATTAQHLVVLSLTWASIFLPSHHQTRVPVWSRRGRDSRLALTPDTYSWERPPPAPPPAQRRNAHRPLHQCMINLPISSLRFHPPSPSPRTAGSGPGPGPGPLLSSSLHSLASPRIRRVEILSHSTTPRGHPSTTRRALSSRFISRSSLGTGRHIVSEPASCITHCPLFHHPPSSLPYRNPPFSGRGYGEKVDADRHQTPDTRYRGHTHPASRGRS